jgi:hypothetical protein
MDIKEAIAFGQYSGHESPQRILADKVIELEREIARVQMELDASCNAEELRQYRHANQFLIVNQGAYERENALLRDALRECLDGAAYTISVDAFFNSSNRHVGLERLERHRSLLPAVVDSCPDSDSALPNA